MKKRYAVLLNGTDFDLKTDDRAAALSRARALSKDGIDAPYIEVWDYSAGDRAIYAHCPKLTEEERIVVEERGRLAMIDYIAFRVGKGKRQW